MGRVGLARATPRRCRGLCHLRRCRNRSASDVVGLPTSPERGDRVGGLSRGGDDLSSPDVVGELWIEERKRRLETAVAEMQYGERRVSEIFSSVVSCSGLTRFRKDRTVLHRLFHASALCYPELFAPFAFTYNARTRGWESGRLVGVMRGMELRSVIIDRGDYLETGLARDWPRTVIAQHFVFRDRMAIRYAGRTFARLMGLSRG